MADAECMSDQNVPCDTWSVACAACECSTYTMLSVVLAQYMTAVLQIEADLAAGPSCIPSLGARLQALTSYMSDELAHNAELDRMHIKYCSIRKLEVLHSILDLEPQPVNTQFSSEAQVGHNQVKQLAKAP